MEVDCQTEIAQELGYLSESELEIVAKQVGRVAALLSGLRNKCLKPKDENMEASINSNSLNPSTLESSNSLIP